MNKGKAPLMLAQAEHSPEKEGHSSSPDSTYEVESEDSSESESCIRSPPPRVWKGRKDRVEITEALIAQIKAAPDATFASKVTARFGKEYRAGQTLDSNALDTLNCQHEFREYFNRIGFNWLLELPESHVPRILADEFFNSFEFSPTSDLEEYSITFKLLGQWHELNLLQWNVRLGIVSIGEANQFDFQTAHRAIPNRFTMSFDQQAAWSALTHPSAGQFKPTHSRATHFLNPILRMCQTFLAYNLLGQTTSFSRVSVAELYFTWCMHEGIKVDLGFWLAYQIKLISSHPTRNITLCHVLGAYLNRRYEFEVADDIVLDMCPSPSRFDLFFLRGTLIVNVREGVPSFYTPGEAALPETVPRRIEQEAQSAPSKGAPDHQIGERMKALEKQVSKQKKQLKKVEGELKGMKDEFKNLTATLNLFMQRTEPLADAQESSPEQRTSPTVEVPIQEGGKQQTTPRARSPEQTPPPVETAPQEQEEEARPAPAETAPEPASHASTSRTRTRSQRTR